MSNGAKFHSCPDASIGLQSPIFPKLSPKNIINPETRNSETGSNLERGRATCTNGRILTQITARVVFLEAPSIYPRPGMSTSNFSRSPVLRAHEIGWEVLVAIGEAFTLFRPASTRSLHRTD